MRRIDKNAGDYVASQATAIFNADTYAQRLDITGQGYKAGYLAALEDAAKEVESWKDGYSGGIGVCMNDTLVTAATNIRALAEREE